MLLATNGRSPAPSHKNSELVLKVIHQAQPKPLRDARALQLADKGGVMLFYRTGGQYGWLMDNVLSNYVRNDVTA